MSHILTSIRALAGELEAIRDGMQCLFCDAELTPAMGKYGVIYVHDDGHVTCDDTPDSPWGDDPNGERDYYAREDAIERGLIDA